MASRRHTLRPLDAWLYTSQLSISYCFRTRLEHRLCEEVHVNLAYRWFCRLDLTDRILGHTTWHLYQRAVPSPAG